MLRAFTLAALCTGHVATAGASQPYEDLVCQYTDWDCAKAYRVLLCESTANPNAVSGSQVGLFQIATQFHSRRLSPGESLYDPEVNVRVAHDIWLEQGYAPWPVCGAR